MPARRSTAPATPASDAGASATTAANAASPPEPEDLRALGLGGYLAGDFGWFDAARRRGPVLGSPGPGVDTVGGLPVLLALLGAFLALQRGIGNGLGHVPMEPTSTMPESRRGR